MVGYSITLYDVSLYELNKKINEQISIELNKGCYVNDIHLEDPKGTLNNLFIAHVTFTNEKIMAKDVYDKSRGCTNPIVIHVEE